MSVCKALPPLLIFAAFFVPFLRVRGILCYLRWPRLSALPILESLRLRIEDVPSLCLALTSFIGLFPLSVGLRSVGHQMLRPRFLSCFLCFQGGLDPPALPQLQVPPQPDFQQSPPLPSVQNRSPPHPVAQPFLGPGSLAQTSVPALRARLIPARCFCRVSCPDDLRFPFRLQIGKGRLGTA